MIIFNQSIVIIKPGEKTDRSGNTVADWSEEAVTRIPADRVSVQPHGSTETTGDDRNTVITGWNLFSRPGVDIPLAATDRVEHDSKTLEVNGEVGRWPHPIYPGRIHHVEAVLQRVTGG